MRRSNRYEIIDEPSPSRLTHLVVAPVFPMFGFMLGGAVVGWCWFVLNAFAIGSPTRMRELFIAIGTLIAVVVLTLALGALGASGTIPENVLPYTGIAIILVKLASMYTIFERQTRGYELYTYFGGPTRSGAPFLIGAIIVGRMLLGDAHPFVQAVLR